MKRHHACLLAVLLLSTPACQRVAPQAIKAIGATASRADGAAARTTATGATPTGRSGKWADHVNTAVDVAQLVQKGTSQPDSRPARPARFPYPASSVVPVSDVPLADPANPGVVAFRNNYGGLCYFDRAGNPLGFSAFNKALNQTHHFDPYGNRR